jgi:hypothetical protein
VTDPRKTAAVLALAELFNRQLSEAALRLYVAALGDIAQEAIEAAVVAAGSSCKFMPSPAELRELAGCGGIRPEDRAALAWEAFSRAVVELGTYKSPDFDDPIINATCRMLGGWERCCGLPVEEFDKWLRHDFLKTYAGLMRSGVNGELTAPLVGYCERENRCPGPECRTVATGLPWAGESPRQLPRPKPRDVPRIEFQKP